MILAFQTVYEPASCMIFDENEIFAEHKWDLQTDRDLLSNILETLKKANKDIHKMQGVFVVNGPGNFSPVRISILLANNFAHNLKVPVFSLRNDEFDQKKDLKTVFYEKKPQAEKMIEPFFGKEPRIEIKK